MKKTVYLLLTAIMLASLLITASPARPVNAASLTVTNTNDSGSGSLRQVIADANPGDTIEFDASLSGGTITSWGQLIIDKDLTIDGTSLDSHVTISGNHQVLVFDVTSGVTAELKGLDIADGQADYGGGIYNKGYLTVTDSTFSANSANEYGGGIYNSGTLTLTDSTFSANNANYGGGIFNNNGTLTVTESTFSGNGANEYGGGIYNFNNGTLTVTDSTFFDNNAQRGGGIYNFLNVTLTVTNSTFYRNGAFDSGGGIYNRDKTLTVSNSTFSDNSANSTGGGIYNYAGTLNLVNNILANSTSGGDCVNDGTMGTVKNNNLIEANYGCGTPISTADPGLGPLQDNGGPTHTMAIDPTSPAFNMGDNTLCPATDQRGLTRPQGDACDIGAFEAFINILYVKPSANGDCSSWSQACALKTARDNASAGDQIWARYGTYKLVGGFPPPRDYEFELKNGVAIYGGFHGEETSLEQRDWVANETIISGDIGVAGDDSDNRYHVVTASGTDSTAILDGFTITAGNADGAYPDNTGGGMYNFNNSSPALTNVTFSGNSSNTGGGMYNFHNSSPALTNVTFSGNSSNAGGGMFNNYSSPTLTNVTFSGNSSNTGGGMYNFNNSSPTLTNVTFSGNSATYYGGGIYNYYSSPSVRNSILWNNRDGSGTGTVYATIYNVSSTITLTHSLVQGSGGSDSWTLDASFVDGGNNIDSDPQYVEAIDPAEAPTTSGNLRLGVGSPAINAGDNQYVTGITTDLDGDPRISGGTVDMGAFETINNIPVAIDDDYSTNEDTPLTMDVLTNDYDLNGDPLVAILQSAPIHGDLQENEDGSFTYTPDANYNGPDSFTYMASDGTDESNIATVTITVNPVNDAPVISTTSNNGPKGEGKSVTITVTASDVDGDTLSYRFDCQNDNDFEIGPQVENTTLCFFADNGYFTVKVKVGDGIAVTSDSTEVTVNNAAPSVTSPDDQTVPLGFADPFDLGSFTDLGGQDNPWEFEADWGDSSAHDSGTISATGTLESRSHIYAAAGWYTVQVSVTDKDGDTGSASFQITIENRIPGIEDIDPHSTVAGSSEFTLNVYGSGFVKTSKVFWNDQYLTSTFVSPEQLQATVATELILDPQVVEITIFNPAPGGGVSDLAVFFVTEIDVLVKSYDKAISLEPEGSAQAIAENVSAEAIDGEGTVVVLKYSKNPTETELEKASDDFSDIYLSKDNIFKQVKITIETVEEESELFWYETPESKWQKVVEPIYHPLTNSITFEVKSDTKPSIEQLTGTVFGLVDGEPYAISATPASQQVQYSDGIADVTIQASDAGETTMTAYASNLPSGMVLSNSTCQQIASNTTCTWTLSGHANVPAGTYEATVSVVDEAENSVAIDVTFIVDQENIHTTFHSGNPVAVRVAEDGGDSGPFELEVRVRETYPDHVPDGTIAQPGDISLALVSMTLKPVGPGGEVPGACSVVGVYDTNYDAFQRVICSFDAVPVNTYLASVHIDGDYYAGDGEDVLVVYDPSRGFTTGGGSFYWPETADTERDYPGDETSFGYTMEYNSNGTNVKGSLLLIRHLENGTIYKVKSNALYALSLDVEMGVSEPLGWASFSGKATYLEPGWPEAIGNYEFLVYVEDRNELGTGIDRLWIEVKDKDRNIVPVMSMPREATDYAENLHDGEVFVPH